jgi:hypothetical protein
MKHSFLRFYAFYALLLALTACDKNDATADAQVRVIKAQGDINAAMNEFRQLLGTLNTAPGATGGRREINWDGVSPSAVNTTFPVNFFNPTAPGSNPSLQRGFTYLTNTGSFRVSDNQFSDVNNNATTEFAAFSGNKTFINTAVNIWDIGFQVPAQTTPASVKGFGLVFVDVDLDNSTYVEFFNKDRSLGRHYAPAHNAVSGFSFLGVYFNNEVVTRIQVVHDGVLQSGGKDITNGGANDLVILDDFIYSEPVAQ